MNSIKKLFLCLGFLVAFVFTTHAAYIEKFPVTVTQPDSTVVYCFVSGDEFYNWVHDSNGYTLIRDPGTGFVVYAELLNDKLVSTGYIVGSVDPAAIGLQPWTIVPASKREQMRNNFIRNAPSSAKGTPTISNVGQNNGTLNNLVIYIRFAGENEFAAKALRYDSMFNLDQANYASMYRYFKETSYGKTLISTTFYPTSSGNTIISYQDIYPRSYFQPYDTNNTNGYTDEAIDNGYDRRIREHELLKRAINAVSSQISSSLNLDFNNDGDVDNICFIVSGGPGAWSSLLWPHQWALYTTPYAYINGKRVYGYNMQIETHLDTYRASVLSHEMFHTLGAPDLYRYYNKTIDPIGSWDLMGSNAMPPQSSTAWMKYKYGGWIDSIPEIKQNGVYTLNDIWSPTNNAYKIASPNSDTEFFVIEHRRTAVYWDIGLPGSGLIIYRVNAALEGNSEGPPDEVYVFRPGGTNTTTNGTISSAYFSSNAGRTKFNDSTTSNPPCFLSNNQPGGIYIKNISAVGTTMSFEVVMTKYIMIASAGQGGTISPSGRLAINPGSNQTYTFTPNSGKVIQAVLVDGVNVPSAITAGSYTFSTVSAHHSIRVIFGCSTAQSLPVAESFNSTTFPPNCWDNESATNALWERVTQSVSGTLPTCTPHSGAGMLHFNSWTYSKEKTGALVTPIIATNSHDSRLTFWMYRDNISIAYRDKINIYLSENQSASGLSLVYTMYVSRNIAPTESTNGWKKYVVILPTSSMSSAYVIFEGVSDNGYNIYLDDIQIDDSTFAASTITATAGSNGTISPSGNTSVNYGANQTFTFTPNTGYHIDSVYIDNVYNAAAVSAGTYTFTNVTANHSIRVTFAVDTFTIISTSEGNGNSSPSGNITVNYGDNQTFTFTPNTGYHIDSVYIDNVYNATAVLAGTYTFTNVTANHSIRVTFAINTYTITVSAGNNGTVSPFRNINVNYGDNQTFNFTPNAGYHIDSVYIDNVYNAAAVSGGTYTFTNVSANHSIRVTFAINTYTITASASGSGHIEPEGIITVNHGDTLTFSFPPTLCGGNLLTLLIDNVSVPIPYDYTYTFDSIVANHTIHVDYSVGIVEYDPQNAITLYPNPATYQVELKIENNDLKAKNIELYDMYGKLLQVIPVVSTNTQIDIGSYSSGIYMIRLNTANGSITKMLVKD